MEKCLNMGWKREPSRVSVGISKAFVFLNIIAVVAMAMSFILSSSPVYAQTRSSPQPPAPFVDSPDYDTGIPSPASVIHHEVGERAVRYPALIRYLRVLADSSDRVILTSYGRTHEGRDLFYLTITSPANHKRLDQIKTDNARLSDPRLLDSERADQLMKTLPAVAWLNYSIHGDELSSTDAGMYISYHLAAAKDEATLKLLDETVIHINPLVNPDGRERYLSYLEQLTGVVSSPDLQAMQHQALWSRGRGNHYLFDLNRDWLVHYQPEVRSLAEVILSWNPHLLVDSHEQGAYDTYLFDPPREPLNLYLSPTVMAWRERFGADQAKAFNSKGWSYYTRDWYSEWGPFYTNSWANLLGTIGLLYEQARANGSSVKQPTGYEVSYRETVHHHIVSSLANLKTLNTNRSTLLRDLWEDRQWALGEEDDDSGVFVLPPSADGLRWKNLVELIGRQGLEGSFALENFTAKNVRDIWNNEVPSKEFPKGTFLAPLKQPHRRMLQALFDFDPHLRESFLLEERKELESRRETLLYDVTSWNLPMTFGIESYWASSVPRVILDSDMPTYSPDLPDLSDSGDYGYLIDFKDSAVYSALVRLFEANCHPRIAIKPFKMDADENESIDGTRGTVLLRAHENPDDLAAILQGIGSDLALRIYPVDKALVDEGPDLGSDKFPLLSAPRVALASQWPVSPYSFGSIWYLLDSKLQLRSSPINIQNLNLADLRKYNVLILPDSNSLGRVLDDKAMDEIKGWVENGGTLIAVGGSASFAADKEGKLSSARLRRDVLDKLAEYEEAVQQESSARNVKIDINDVWQIKPVKDKSGKQEAKKGTDSQTGDEAKKPDESKTKLDADKLKRRDEWDRLFSPTGTFVKGIVDPEHWMGFGLGEKTPVLFWGDNAYMSKYPVKTPVRLAGEEDLRLSGLLWPEARQRLADTAYVTVESMGRGQIILFATDPTHRMWLAGAQRLFLNAVLLGPGMGASQPVPW
ncbi:MAG: hypothetical protein JW896_08790 [Deltaproteobacteria bacterium]|nr:hypothetical protein [Deltaproteobacteria bacterium]